MAHPLDDASPKAPDTTPAPTAAAWLNDPDAPFHETAMQRLIHQWETEPEAPASE